MQVRSGTLRINFEPQDESTAQVIGGACDEVLILARDCWGLAHPLSCQFYVMTSWRGFIFQSAPPFWKLGLAVYYPLWSRRASRMWPYSAGWTQHFGRRIAIGIKPPRLLEISDKSVGALLFVEEKDSVTKIRHLTCHELIHAASAHLHLPAWLNEGLATLSVDRFLGKPTIRDDSLGLLVRMQPKARPPSYRAMARLQGATLAYHAVRGYWIVSLLEETHPGFLRRLLEARRSAYQIEVQVAECLGIERAKFWQEIDSVVTGHFLRRGPAIV